MADEFPPISNYKGVMLCDRPSADTMPKRPQVFISAGVPPEQLGLNPSKKLNVHSTENRAKDTSSILYQHKQYLSQLQKDIREQKAAEADGEARAVEKRKKFVERSAQLRDAVRAGLLGPPEEEPADDEAPAEYTEAAAADTSEPPAAAAMVPPLKLGKKDLSKPAWAFTEEGAEERDELAEEVDVDDLLDFVENLDFESYVDDLEVQQALEIMRSRVTNLDTQRSTTAPGETTERTQKVPLRPQETNQTAPEAERPGTAQSAQEDAKVLLQSSRNLRKVHSTKSMAARLEKLSEEVVLEDASALLAAMDAEYRLGAKSKKEVDPSNLPYLYRSPAV